MFIQNITNYQNGLNFKGVEIERASHIIKSPIKVLFSDLDNTILTNGNISSAHFVSIKRLLASGVRLIIATGRGYKTLNELFSKLGMPFEYAITSSGGTVVDNKGNKLYESTLSIDCTNKILEFTKNLNEQDIFLRFTFDGIPYFNRMKGLVMERVSSAKYIDSYDKFISKGIMPSKAEFLIYPEPQTYEDIMIFTKKIKQNLNDKDLNIVHAAKCCCEIMKRDVSKGNALEFLKEVLGYDYKNIACIGDAENDIEMANLVTQNGGMSIAMGNSTNYLKEVSRFITSSVSNNGFSKAVEAILNINKRY